MDPVASTAHWVAAARARESLRPDALFRDPYAAALTGGVHWDGFPELPFGQAYIALRTRFFDDELLRATRDGRVRQVVLLAAGMDARAYRLDFPIGTRLFELDRPEVLAFKERTLEALGAHPRCERASIGVDLTQPWENRLRAAGFSARRPSAWLTEGLLVYLQEADVHGLFDRIAALAAPGSKLALDLAGEGLATSEALAPLVERLRERGIDWHFTTDQPVSLLSGHGFYAEAFGLAEIAARYGRELPAGEDPFHTRLVTAIRRRR